MKIWFFDPIEGGYRLMRPLRSTARPLFFGSSEFSRDDAEVMLKFEGFTDDHHGFYTINDEFWTKDKIRSVEELSYAIIVLWALPPDFFSLARLPFNEVIKGMKETTEVRESENYPEVLHTFKRLLIEKIQSLGLVKINSEQTEGDFFRNQWEQLTLTDKLKLLSLANPQRARVVRANQRLDLRDREDEPTPEVESPHIP